jgi:hypothetical protein
MAYSLSYKTGNPLDDDNSDPSAQALTAGAAPMSEVASGGPATGSASAPSNESGTFRDFNKYADLNQGQTQALADNVSGNIQTVGDTARADRATFDTNASNAIAGATNRYDPSSKSELEHPESVSDQYRKLLSGSYSGPQSADAVEGYSKLAEGSNRVQQITDQADTTEGRKQLISSLYGTGNNGLKAGELSLDQYLLQNVAPAFATLTSKVGEVKPLAGLAKDAATQLQTQAGQAAQANRDAAAMATGDVNAARNETKSQVEARVGQKQAEAQMKIDQAKAAAQRLSGRKDSAISDPYQTQEIGPDIAQEAASLGISPEEYAQIVALNGVVGGGVDFSQYLNATAPQYNVNNVATTADLDRYNNLGALIGKTPDWLSSGQLQTAAPAFGFNASGAIGNLNNAKAAGEAQRATEEQQRANEAAQAQSTRDMAEFQQGSSSGNEGDQSGGNHTANDADFDAAKEGFGDVVTWLQDNPNMARAAMGVAGYFTGLPVGTLWSVYQAGKQAYDVFTRDAREGRATQAQMDEAAREAMLAAGREAQTTMGDATGASNPNANISAEDRTAEAISGARQGPATVESLYAAIGPEAFAELNGGNGYSPESWTYNEATKGWDYTDNNGKTFQGGQGLGGPGVDLGDIWDSITSFFGGDNNGNGNSTAGSDADGDGTPDGFGDEGSGTASQGGAGSGDTSGNSDWNRGGAIPKIGRAAGGQVKGDNQHGVDDVATGIKGGPKVMLDGGEYIIPADITEMLGAHNLDRFMKLMGASPKVEMKRGA